MIQTKGMLNTGRKALRLSLLKAAALAVRKPKEASRRQRVLLLRPDHLGDVLFTTPALRLLRQSLPEAHITCMVGPWTEAVIRHNPNIDEIITCPFPGFTRRSKGTPWSPYGLLFKEAQRLKGQAYDLAIVLRYDFWWGAMLAAFAAIPERVGYDVVENQPFLTRAVRYLPGRHEVEQNLRLVQDCLGLDMPAPGARTLDFYTTKEEEGCAERWLQKDGKTIIVLHPGAGAPVKQWRNAAFASLADGLVESYGAEIVLTGSPAERHLLEAIQARMKAPARLLLRASLGQLAAVLKRCDLAVGVDSGVMHLAVAVGIPTVHLYGPAGAATFGPWGNEMPHLVVTSDLGCIPCQRLDYTASELGKHPCVRLITVMQVMEAAQKALRRKPCT